MDHRRCNLSFPYQRTMQSSQSFYEENVRRRHFPSLALLFHALRLQLGIHAMAVHPRRSTILLDRHNTFRRLPLDSSTSSSCRSCSTRPMPSSILPMLDATFSHVSAFYAAGSYEQSQGGYGCTILIPVIALLDLATLN